MIEVHNISKWFGEGHARTCAVRDASFSVAHGEMLYIVGPSGSGKTTLLSIISGILRPDSGSVTVNGVDIWNLDSNALADFRLRTVGFVFQDYHLFPRLSALENVAIPLVLRRERWEKGLEAAHLALEAVGLASREGLSPKKLSGGEQQRVAIARAIVAAPDLLIFDEPTASLDGDTGKKIVTFVRDNILSGQRAIIIVTHDERIYEFASRILRMEDGQMTGEQEKIP